MKIFVTGAQGFVGRYVVGSMLRGCTTDILGIGRSSRQDDTFTHAVRCRDRAVQAPLPEQLKRTLSDRRYRYEAVDITDRKAVAAMLRGFRPDVVVHLASGLRDDDTEHLERTNVLGSTTLVEAVAEAGAAIRMLVLGSTGGVYGAAARIPIPETAPFAPVDPYSRSKAAAERATRELAQRESVPVLWARLFNIVGPGQDERHVCGRFAAQAVAIAHGASDKHIEAGNLESTRDFIDVRDVALALERLAIAGVAGEAYNVSSGVEVKIGDVLDLTLRAAAVESVARLTALPPRENDIARHAGDASKLEALGFRRRFSLAESVGDVVRYYVEDVERTAATGSSS
ncbi:MAG: NAD-dependent epimerase/dehydratase family protein [Candidatus Eremiobacterales bacterium]